MLLWSEFVSLTLNLVNALPMESIVKKAETGIGPRVAIILRLVQINRQRQRRWAARDIHRKWEGPCVEEITLLRQISDELGGCSDNELHDLETLLDGDRERTPTYGGVGSGNVV